jgi:hypothetical protein
LVARAAQGVRAMFITCTGKAAIRTSERGERLDLILI